MVIYCYKIKKKPLSFTDSGELTRSGDYYEFEFFERSFRKLLGSIMWPVPLTMAPGKALNLIAERLPCDPEMCNLAWNWYLEGNDLNFAPPPDEDEYELMMVGCQGPWDGDYFEWLEYHREELSKKVCEPYIDMDEVESFICSG